MISTADFAELNRLFHCARVLGKMVWFPVAFLDQHGNALPHREYVQVYFLDIETLLRKTITPQAVTEKCYPVGACEVVGVEFSNMGENSSDTLGYWEDEEGGFRTFVCERITIIAKPIPTWHSHTTRFFQRKFSINESKKLIEEYCTNPENAGKDLYFFGVGSDGLEIFKLPVSMAFDELFERLVAHNPNGKNLSKFKLRVGDDGKMVDCVIDSE